MKALNGIGIEMISDNFIAKIKLGCNILLNLYVCFSDMAVKKFNFISK